jgi:hypothetical protein
MKRSSSRVATGNAIGTAALNRQWFHQAAHGEIGRRLDRAVNL